MGKNFNNIFERIEKMTADWSTISREEKAQMACTFSALMLHDAGEEITGDKISKVLKKAGVEFDSYWPGLFARALAGQNIDSFLTVSGGGGGGQVASGPAPTGGQAAPKEEEKAPEPEEEEEDMDLGDLFG